jgi:hypothetical protein
VGAHLKAHRKAAKAAAKAGEAAPHPKELHAALSKAAKAHQALKAARETHKENQRVTRNAAARERRARAKAGPVEAKVEPVKPNLRDQADTHRANKGERPTRAKMIGDKMQKEYGKLHKKQEKIEKEADSFHKLGRAAENRADKAETKAERTALKNESESHYRKSREIHDSANAIRKRKATLERRAVAVGKVIREKSVTPKSESPKPTSPPHTGLTSSQAKPAPTDKGTRAERLAVLAHKHEARSKDLNRRAAESYRTTGNRLTASGKSNTHIDGKAGDDAYARAAALNQRSAIHFRVANRLREAAGAGGSVGNKVGNTNGKNGNPVDNHHGMTKIVDRGQGKNDEGRRHMADTKAEKLTKSQQYAWDEIRHAVPQELNSLGEVSGRSQWNDGHVHTGQQNTGTIEALARKGHIEVVRIGGWAHDVVRPTRDLGDRTATVELQPRSDYQTRDRVRIRAGHGASTDVVRDGIKAHEVADVLAKTGWKVKII